MASGPRELLSSSALDSESFRVYCYKIVPCAKKFGHDWSECPFAHEGEKATRRCPALYRYSSIVCPEIRQSKACPRGDACPYSHSIFEYWMHPARFRAQLCSFGTDCNRRICFFAHTQEQLRIPSEPVVADALASRAPYLQGRVAPESRYALYPEQVPSLIAGQGRMLLLQQQQQPAVQLVAAADMGATGLAGVPQVVYVPAGAPGQPVVAVSGAPLAAGQQWAGTGGSNMMYVPANQPGAAAASMGYYMAAPGAVGAGMSTVSGGQEYASTPMMVAAPTMQMVGGGYGSGTYSAGGYSGGQPVQLMTAVVGADGSVPSYSIAAGGVAGGGVAYAPVYATPGAPGIAQWGAQQPQMQQQQPPGQQQQQQQPQQLLVGSAQQQQPGQPGQQQPGQQPPPPPPLQLVSVREPSDGGACGVSRTPQHPQDGRGFILTPAGQLDAQYMMSAPVVHGAVGGMGATAGPAGPGLLQQSARSSMGGASQSAGAVDGSNADEIAQQMAGWHIQ